MTVADSRSGRGLAVCALLLIELAFLLRCGQCETPKHVAVLNQMCDHGTQKFLDYPVDVEHVNTLENELAVILKAEYANCEVSVLVHNPIPTWAKPPLQVWRPEICDIKSDARQYAKQCFPDDYPSHCFLGGGAFKFKLHHNHQYIAVAYRPAGPDWRHNPTTAESIGNSIREHFVSKATKSIELGGGHLLMILRAISKGISPSPRAVLMVTENTALPASGMKSLLSLWLPYKFTRAPADFNNKDLHLLIWILPEPDTQFSSDSQVHPTDQSHTAGQSHTAEQNHTAFQTHYDSGQSLSQGVLSASTLPMHNCIYEALQDTHVLSSMMTAARHIQEKLISTFTAEFIKDLFWAAGRSSLDFEALHFAVFFWGQTERKYTYYLHQECNGAQTRGDPPLLCYVTGGATEFHELLESVTIMVTYWRPSDALPTSAVDISRRVNDVFQNLCYGNSMVHFTTQADFYSYGAAIANLHFQGADLSQKYNRVVLALSGPFPLGWSASLGGPFFLDTERRCTFLDDPSTQPMYLLVFVLPAGIF